jgi:cytochrome P450
MTTTEERPSRSYDPADLSSVAFWSGTAADRERTFAELRRERPVSWHPPVERPMFEDPDDRGFWAVVRHADLVEVTKRHEDFRSGEGIVFDSMPQELLDAGQGFIAMDPPRHTRIRRLLASAFTPRQMRRIGAQIEANARRVVDAVADRGEVEFVSEVAALVPLHNICDMVGVPAEHRLTILNEAELVGGWRDSDVMAGQDPAARLFEATMTMFGIVDELMQARREDPRDDLLTALIEAEVDGERLDEYDIASFFNLLMIAGTDTTRQSISHGLKALTDFPDQREWLLADLPGRMPSAVEEIVRWATPIMTFRRTAARDCALAGQQIRAGEKVILFYASANWDTDVFDRPERLDLSRAPNRHVSFGGGGIHHCLGNQLARMQIAATFTELLTRLPDIHVVGEPHYSSSNFFHGVNSMTVRFTPEAGAAVRSTPEARP